MSWGWIPPGLSAANHWLANLEPSKGARKRKHFAKAHVKIEAALAHDKELLKLFVATVSTARWMGRVDGLREGLELYEYGWRIQEDKTPAFRSMMKYFVKNVSNSEKHSAEEVCNYLDKEIRRIKMNVTSEASIRPPDAWGCETWKLALKNKRNNVEVLVSEAKDEAFSQQFSTLRAWRTWGRNKQKKVRAGKPKEQLDRPEPL